MPIEIHNLQTAFPVHLKHVARAVRAACSPCKDVDISISLVADADIQRINAQYLDHDYATDVIAFDYRENPEEGGLSGEIIVSAETALRAARKRQRDPIDELLLYVVHGALHLMGYDDRQPRAAALMRCRQAAVLKRLGR